MSLNGRCCIFQPFDKGSAFDKRYEGTIAPAVEAAGLEPYRVDRDESAVILIDTLHEEIKAARICVADITTRNPNVMYELGYAIAAGKDVVIICSTQQQAEHYPFDIRHRGIIPYTPESLSDLKQLEQQIIGKLSALLKKQEMTETLQSKASSPMKSTDGLQPKEVAALALIMANADSASDTVNAGTIKSDMEAAGYTRIATRLALTRLVRLGMIESTEINEGYGNCWTVYNILTPGEDWLLENQDSLELHMPVESKTSTPKKLSRERQLDDEVPF